MRLLTLGMAAVLGLSISVVTFAESFDTGKSDLEILKTYADDYQTDPLFEDSIKFGIEVGDAWYVVEGTPGVDGSAGSVEVRTGAPEHPTFYFIIESSGVLRKLDAGKVSVLTLAGKAQSSDYAPVDIVLMEGEASADPYTSMFILLEGELSLILLANTRNQAPLKSRSEFGPFQTSLNVNGINI